MSQKIFKLRGLMPSRIPDGYRCDIPNLVIPWQYYFDHYDDFINADMPEFDITVKFHVKENHE